MHPVYLLQSRESNKTENLLSFGMERDKTIMKKLEEFCNQTLKFTIRRF